VIQQSIIISAVSRPCFHITTVHWHRLSYLGIHVVNWPVFNSVEPHLKSMFLGDQLTAVGVQLAIDWHQLVKPTGRLFQLNLQLLYFLYSSAVNNTGGFAVLSPRKNTQHNTSNEHVKYWFIVTALKTQTSNNNYFTAIIQVNDMPSVLLCLPCFDAVGWATGRASGL